MEGHEVLLEEPLDQPVDEAAGAAGSLSDPGEAAAYLGVAVSTVYGWARTGRLPCVVTLGGHLRFSKADLDAAAVPRPRAARRRRPPQPAS